MKAPGPPACPPQGPPGGSDTPGCHPAAPGWEPRTLRLKARGPVLEIWLNRPEVRNAMSSEMVGELGCALTRAESDGQTRVIVLRGKGGHFCAGADLKDLAASRTAAAADGTASGWCNDGESDADPIARGNACFGRMCAAYATTPLAVVAVLEGTVMGGGMGLACIADVALASATASFRLPETSLGIVPAQIAPYLVDRLGISQARRLAVTGGTVGARDALDIGLVHAVHSPCEIDQALATVLRDILRCAPGALAATKALMARARFAPAPDLVKEAAAAFARSARGPEGSEGMAAFLARRTPAWSHPSDGPSTPKPAISAAHPAGPPRAADAEQET